MHLITLDAVRLYLAKLAPGGVLLFNISNPTWSLSPSLARSPGRPGRRGTRDAARLADAERLAGKVDSQWVVMARREEDLGALRDDPLGRPARRRVQP